MVEKEGKYNYDLGWKEIRRGRGKEGETKIPHFLLKRSKKSFIGISFIVSLALLKGICNLDFIPCCCFFAPNRVFEKFSPTI